MASKKDEEARKQELTTKLNQKLAETGEKDKLKEFLRQRLNETGWYDEMELMVRDMVKSKGPDNVTVDDLVSELMPKARGSVSASVKRDLVQKVRNFIDVQKIQ